MNKDFSDVMVLIPTLNEAKSISKTIETIVASLPGSRLIVVDNGSTDETVSIANKMGVKVLHEPQKGKGFAIRRGFRSLPEGVNVIFMVDGDDTYGCEKLVAAVKLVSDYGFDMVVGNRVIREDLVMGRKAVYRPSHVMGNLFLSWISKILHSENIQDSLSGWRVMSKGFVKSFPGGASGFEIEAELNAHAYLIRASVYNIDVFYQGRTEDSDSKLQTYRDGIRILRMNLALFRNNRPQMAFSILSLPLLLLSLILIGRAVIKYLQTGLVLQFPSLIAGVGAFIISTLLIVTGMILQRTKLIRENLAQYMYSESKCDSLSKPRDNF